MRRNLVERGLITSTSDYVRDPDEIGKRRKGDRMNETNVVTGIKSLLVDPGPAKPQVYFLLALSHPLCSRTVRRALLRATLLIPTTYKQLHSFCISPAPPPPPPPPCSSTSHLSPVATTHKISPRSVPTTVSNHLTPPHRAIPPSHVPIVDSDSVRQRSGSVKASQPLGGQPPKPARAMLLPKGSNITWKSARSRLPPTRAIWNFLTRTKFLLFVVLFGIVVLIWNGVRGTAGDWQRYVKNRLARHGQLYTKRWVLIVIQVLLLWSGQVANADDGE